MSNKIDSNQTSTSSATTTAPAAIPSNNQYSFTTNSNNNTNNQDVINSINRTLDQTKDNINRSIDESRNQIPRYNSIVNSYQEQSLQTAREISAEYIESQKSIINSLQSAWRPFNERFGTVFNSWNSPEAVAKAYSRFVSNVADNAVSAIRLTNNIIFSNVDSWKSVLQQAKDNSKHISNLSVNAAKIFEQNSKEISEAASASADSQKANTTSNTI